MNETDKRIFNQTTDNNNATFVTAKKANSNKIRNKTKNKETLWCEQLSNSVFKVTKTNVTFGTFAYKDQRNQNIGYYDNYNNKTLGIKILKYKSLDFYHE